VQRFHALLTSEEPYKQLSFDEKNAHTRRLQSALREKRFVEASTQRVIHTLQDAGCAVFGLTARYSEMATCTRKAMLQLGVDFAKTAPFPYEDLRDPVTGAFMSGGVIYTNARDKGIILDRFLEHIVFREVLKSVSNPLAGTHAQRLKRAKSSLPAELIFVDDRKENCDCVANGVSIPQKLGVRLVSYHFNPLSEDSQKPNVEEGTCDSTEAADQSGSDVNLRILRVQMQYFLEKCQVLTNAEAENILNHSSAQSQAMGERVSISNANRSGSAEDCPDLSSSDESAPDPATFVPKTDVHAQDVNSRVSLCASDPKLESKSGYGGRQDSTLAVSKSTVVNTAEKTASKLSKLEKKSKKQNKFLPAWQITSQRHSMY